MSTLSTRQAEQNLAFPLDDYLYHEAVGVVIVAVPKVGCSTIKRWFMRHAEADPRLDAHKYAFEHLALARRPASEAQHILESRRVLMPVRDPADRLRSAFVDKFIRPKAEDLFEPAREIIEDLQRAKGVHVVHDAEHVAMLGEFQVRIPICSAVDYTRGPSFREFVDYVCDADPSHLDAHWRAQSAFIGENRIDALVPLEHLSEHLQQLSKAIGAPEFQPAAENVTRKEPVLHAHLADTPAGELHTLDLFPTLEQITDEPLLRKISEHFREDINLLARARART